VELLQAVVCSPKCPQQIQLLCAAILREMAPCDGLRLSCERIHDTKLLSLVSSVLLAQVSGVTRQASSLVNMDLFSDSSVCVCGAQGEWKSAEDIQGKPELFPRSFRERY